MPGKCPFFLGIVKTMLVKSFYQRVERSDVDVTFRLVLKMKAFACRGSEKSEAANYGLVFRKVVL